MSIKVQKYLLNMGKSVAYTASDVLSEKFEFVNDFKNENQEVFKSAYSSIKDYRTTFTRIKKTITNNKIMDAARVGFDSVLYSVTSGDFYAKEKENEVVMKYGGNLMEGMDIDDDDFNWENEDLSMGDKVVATAIKKNSKISTAITTEAIVKTGKAQMDVSRENTMLLYTQNERLMNKLDGGLNNIMGFLKQNGEQTAKVQNQMNENLNKFMTNVDNNVVKLTKQMDELLEMQRNMYKPTKEEEKKRVGYDDIISRNGVINIKEYAKMVKKNAFNTINEQSGNMLSMIFGDSMGGANMLAQFAATPFRSLMSAGANKMLGKKFDSAAKELNTTLEGIIPAMMAKLNAASNKEDAGIMKFIGKIFGVKDKSNESVSTDKYTKGAIPFDGITKRAITDVIPYYLRKMTSYLSGGEEMVYDYQTGRWKTIRSVKQDYDRTVHAARDNTSSTIVKTLESGIGRSLSSAFNTKRNYDRYMEGIEALASRLQTVGDFGSINESDLRGTEGEVYRALKKVMGLDRNGKHGKEDRRFLTTSDGKKISSGLGRSAISSFNSSLRSHKVSQNSSIKSMNEGDTIARIIAAEGLDTKDLKTYFGRDFVGNKGDISNRKIQEMPISQALVRAKDEYGYTLYQYLRDMGTSLRVIKAHSAYLGVLPNSKKGRKSAKPVDLSAVLKEGTIKYDESQRDKNYSMQYYSEQADKREKEESDRWEKSVQNRIDKAKNKGQTYSVATTTDFKSNDKETGLARLISDNEADQTAKAETEYYKAEAKKEKEKWDRLSEIFPREQVNKLKEISAKFDKDKSLKENMQDVKGFTNQLYMFSKWAGSKVGKPGDAAADTILKVDYYLQNLIYGEDLKESERKQSLFERMKSGFDEHMKDIKAKIGDGFDWLKKKAGDFFEKSGLKKLSEKIFGEVDPETGVRHGGVFGNFIGGVQKGLRKNGEDVWNYTKKQAEAAKRALGIKDKTESDSSSTSSDSANTNTLNQKMSQEEIEAKKQELRNRKHQKFGEANTDTITKKEYEKKKAKDKISKHRKRLHELRQEDIALKNEEKKLKKELEELMAIYNSYTYYKQTPPVDIINRKNEIESRLSEINEILYSVDEKDLNNIGPALPKREKLRHRQLQELDKLKHIRSMAVGGVNKTGKPFQSVLSAGEYLNGSKISQTGIYTIPKGGVVVNPAPASVRSKQAANERHFLSNLKRNAEANDKLEPVSTDDNSKNNKNQDAESKKKEKLASQKAEITKIANTDWTKLEDDKQRAEWLGNMASRGIIGGGLGLLAGGPILGAAIGAASSLTKSTNGFANFLFGDAKGVDEDGNVQRVDNGLISKELMDAVPSIKKFGLGGLVAGLLTPIGPLGGVLVGSALGFAKNSEIFQGSLFGEGGVLSDENISKLKKGAKNMGIGAVIGAFTGPFGLVGNALLGATAGYVTSTDKFKDAILGKKDDPNDPESKRHGGVVGTLKKAINPLKDFGKTLVNGITDAIFGKKNGDDKREGGLFGIVKDKVINPLADGTKSIVKELQNRMVDLKFGFKKIWKNIQKRMAGGNFFGVFGERANKVAKGAIGLAKGGARVALSPFTATASAVKGVGNIFKRKRIRTGRADDMTSRERLKARNSLGMSAIDDYSEFDEKLSMMDNDSITQLMDRLSFTVNDKDALSKEENSVHDESRAKLEDILTSTESNKVMKMIKSGHYSDAERYINTTSFKGRKGSGVSQEERAELIKLARKHKKDTGSLSDRFKKAEEVGKLNSQEIKDTLGIDIDLGDEQSVDNIMRMLRREKAHNEAGLTEEDMEYDKLREFWSNEKSPLKTVNEGVISLVNKVDTIINEYKLGKEYDKLSDEEKAKYSSKEEYISKKTSQVKESNDKLNGENNKPANQKFSRIKSVQENPDIYSDTIKKLATDALYIFDTRVMDEIKDPQKIKLDIDKWKLENPDKEDAKYVKLSREIIITEFGTEYKFTVNYGCNTGKTSTVKISKNQEDSYTDCREAFANAYLDLYIPKDIKKKFPHMGLKEMIKKTIKMSAFCLVASAVIPGSGLVFLGLKALDSKLKIREKVKKFNPIGKAKAGLKKVFGSHEIDNNSKAQKRREKKYSEKAKKALEQAIANNDSKLNDIAMEKYKTDYANLDEDKKKVVNDEFMARYKDEKISRQISGRGLIGGVKKIGQNAIDGVKSGAKKLAGTVKSGVKNAISGALDSHREKKAKKQETNNFIDNFIDKLEHSKLRKEKKDFEGKKDSKWAKIIKWLFIGGIAAPIVVGFVKEKLVPAIHEKIQPWIKKAGEKLIGKKNPQTGEYEGGLVSGIVNPIRGFFKDKFRGVHDWFTNEGKYSDENTGMKGLLKNIKGIGEYVIELWKSGSATIYGEWMPKIAQSIGEHAIPVMWEVLKGFGNFLKNVLSGKGNNDDGTDFSGISDSGGQLNSGGKTIHLNTGFGKKVELTVPSNNTSIGDSSIGVTSNGTNYEVQPDGTKHYSNEITGKEMSSQKIDDNDMYSIGKAPNGKEIYVKNGTNVRYFKDGTTGTYIPVTEYQMVDNPELTNNSELQHFAELEADNKLQAGYSGESVTTKGAKAGIKALFHYNNLRIIGGKTWDKAARKATSILPKATKFLPTLGGKITHLGTSAIDKGFHLASDITTPLQTKGYELIDKASGGLFTKAGQKAEAKAAEKAAAKAADKAAKKQAMKLAFDEAKGKALTKAKNVASKIATKIESKGGLASKILNVIKSIKGKISGVIKKVFNNGKVKKVLSKVFTKNADDIAKGVETAIVDTVEKNVDTIAAKGASIGAKTVAKAIPIISVVADFLLGMDDCRNILGIISEKPSFMERVCGGIINMIPSLIMTLADVVGAASFGAATPISVIMYVLSVIGIVILSFEPIRNVVVGAIIDLLDKIPGIDMSEIKKERKEAQDAVAAYNAKNNTSLNIEEYNNLIGNKTLMTKAKDGVKNGWSAMFGYDSATKGDILSGTEDTKGKNKDAEKVRKKLSTIFSSIWQHFGDSDFNWRALDKDGNELDGKEQLNANQLKFNQIGIEVVSGLITLLNGEESKTIEKVSDNVTDFTGPIDSRWHLKKVFKKGKENPRKYFDIDEEHASWKRIKAIAGVCAIMCEIFEPIGKNNQVTCIILDKMIPAYFTSEEPEVIDWSKQMVNDNLQQVDMSSYTDDGQTVEQPVYDTEAEEVIATNANASNKLSKMSDKQLEAYNKANGTNLTKKEFQNKFGGRISNKLFNPVNIRNNITSLIDSGMSVLDMLNPINIANRIKGIVQDPSAAVGQAKNTISNIIGNGFNFFRNIPGYIGKGFGFIRNGLSSLRSNADADDGLSPIADNPLFKTMGSFFSGFATKAINSITGGGFDKVGDLFSNLKAKNKSVNEAIDSLDLLPSDNKYWNIELDEKNPFFSGLFNFMESMSRVVKAPFALAAASMSSGLSAIANERNSSNSSNSNNSSTNSSNSNNNSTSSSGTTTKKKTGVIGSLLSKVVKAGKSLLGRGKDDEDSDTGYGEDPFHIYQRDYKGSYRTAGDTENQTVADSGCGPAAAASLLRMYGKKGDMNNAVRYALNNKYKEVDGGTYPQYFNDYLNKNGISTNSNANNEDVLNNLVHNKPVILMGRDLSNSGRTPYGSKYSHYVVARGLDSNGNVIVEDSEDKNGSTRYSLADTLRNSSVKITTGNGKYGRAKSNSVMESYIYGINSVVHAGVLNVINNASNSITGSKAGNSTNNNNNTNTANAGTNGTCGDLTKDSDVKTTCGYTADELKSAISSINPGCSAEQFPEAAIALEKSRGVNALFSISVAIQEHGWNGHVGINTTGANYGNWNVFNVEGPNTSNGRWRDYDSLEDAFDKFGELIMGSSYYGAGLTTPAKIGNRYCPPDAAENSGYSPWGESVCEVASLIASKISGKGRGKLDKVIRPAMTSKFMNNVSSVIGHYANQVVGNAGGDSVSDNQSNNNNSSSGTANIDIDASTTIICGDSITFGLSSTSLGSRAMGLSSGTTDKNNTTNAGSYESIFKSKSDIIEGASDAIFFWGMNEVFTSQSTDDYFNQYQDSINTILGYGGRSTSDTNIYILPVIWVPDNSGYGGSYNASAVEAFNDKYIKPFAQKKGYTFVDIYEDSKQVPHGAGDVHPSDYQKLYEIIKAHMSGNSSTTTETEDASGSGRGRKIADRVSEVKENTNNIIRKNIHNNKISSGKGRNTDVTDFVGGKMTKESSLYKRKKKYGRGIWGRDGEDDTTQQQSSEVTEDTTNTEVTDEESTTIEAKTTSDSNSKSEATGLISLLGKYSKALTKGIFGDFYDALYGSEADDSSSSNNNNSFSGSLTEGDAEANMKAMFNYMKSEGFSDNLAAGILGNIKGESGFDPHIVEGGAQGDITTDMAHGYGLIQWTGAAGRACLYNWCTANKCDPETLDGQTKWIVAQVKGINISDEANTANASMFNGQSGQGTMSYNWSLFQARGSFDTFNTYSIEKAVQLWLECAERPADMSGALTTRIGYAKEILAACTSGSGRGKDVIEKTIKNKPTKIAGGRGVWGRDGEEFIGPTKPDNLNNTVNNNQEVYGPQLPDDLNNTENTTDKETTTDETNNTSSNSSSNVGAKSLISKLGKYAKAGIKGVFGNFYDALYGSEVEEGDVDGSNNGGYTDGSGIVYAAAMVFEANQHVNPDFVYQLGSYPTLTCKDGTKIDKVLTDCSGMMTATVQYLGYYTPKWSGEYSETYHGNNMTVSGFHAETENNHPINIKNKDGQVAQEFTVMEYPGLSGLQAGDMLIYVGHHIEMYCYTDSQGVPRGFNAGSSNGMKDAVPLAEYVIQNGGALPDASTCMGSYLSADTYFGSSGAQKILRYSGGNGGSGRGKGKVDFAKLNSKIQKIHKPSEGESSIGTDTYRNAIHGKTGRGNGILKSLDEVQTYTKNKQLFGDNSTYSSGNITKQSTTRYTSTSNSISDNNITNTNNSIDLNQLITLINVIANNSDKMDAILQLLGTIAVNTENTSTAVSNNNKQITGSKNGLSALRNALDNNSSGVDIAKAVYQIAKS